MKIIEVSFEVEPERIDKVVRKIKEFYPDLKVSVEDNKVSVSGDLRNYRKRDMIVWMLTEGEHGQALQTS